jgi:hypothetical protein
MAVVYNKQPEKQHLENPRVLMLPELLQHRRSQMQGSSHTDQAWSCSSALQQLAGNLDQVAPERQVLAPNQHWFTGTHDATTRLPMHSTVSVPLTVPVSV